MGPPGRDPCVRGVYVWRAVVRTPGPAGVPSRGRYGDWLLRRGWCRAEREGSVAWNHACGEENRLTGETLDGRLYRELRGVQCE